MDSVSISTGRLKHVMRQIKAKKFNYRVCFARDIVGPGGGVYITANTELDERYLGWLDRRNPTQQGDSFVDVVFYKGDVPSPREPSIPLDELDLPAEDTHVEEDYRKRAETVSNEVVGRAGEVVKQAEGVYKSLNKPDFTIADLRGAEVEGSLREFEQRIKAFHGAVKRAIGEYMMGNSLVLDLIVKYKLNKKAVRHALNVAAFATEMAVQLAFKQHNREDNLADYFKGLSRDDLLERLGEPDIEDEEMTPEDIEDMREVLFKMELTEIFLGGFMHDCGLWNEPFCLDEGHEVKGAKVIWELRDLQKYAPSLVKTVLFHSDIIRLADRYGVVKVVEAPEDPESITFKREFFRTSDDAKTAIEMRPGDFMASLLSDDDLRKVIPVALAERYITQTQDITSKAHWEVINDLARYIKGGLFMRYMATLCNSQVEVVAPRRAYVKLQGMITVTVADRKEVRRAQRLEVTDFEAASIHHGGDRNSPHLISLFIRRPDGSRDKADYVGPKDLALWERSAGLSRRMYIPSGRFRNNMSIWVTGFISEEVYGKILQEYEQEFKLRRS